MKTKKLLVAVCLLLISATMLGTASFAWFSMNTQVDVDGIEVEAYSDSLFLEISEDNTTYATSVNLSSNGEKMLRLAKHGFVGDAWVITWTQGTGNYKSSDSSTQYYKLIAETVDSYAKYVKVAEATGELAPGTNVKGLYKNIIFDEQTQYDPTADTTTYSYFKLDAGKYVPVTSVADGDDVKGYYALAKTASAIATDSFFDGNGTYFAKNDDGEYYNVTSTLEKGTDLSAFYKIGTKTEVVIDGDGKALVSGDVYLASTGDAADEYAFYAKYATETDIADVLTEKTLYFGRAYSDVVTGSDVGDIGDTLSIIKAASLDNYRYTDTVYIRNANNTNTSSNLEAAFNVAGADNDLKGAIRVLLYVTDADTGAFVNTVYYDNGNGTVTYGNGNNIVERLLGNEQETLKVEIYVYFDGTDAAANNSNVEAGVLDGQTVEIKFTIDEQPYNAQA